MTAQTLAAAAEI